MKVLGYYVHKTAKINVHEVMIVIDEQFSPTHDFTCYSPYEQHGGMTRGYFNECKQIKKEEYLEASKGYYTPKEYLI